MAEISLKKIIRPFEKKRNDLAIGQILTCAIPMGIIFPFLFYAAQQSLLPLLLALSILQALFYVRLFIVFHDCAHNNFFTNSAWNTIVGHVIGWLSLTPLELWKHMHNQHHSGAANLDHRNMLDVLTYTTKEYQEIPWYHKMGYLFFRSAFFQLFLYLQLSFIIAFRIPHPMFSKKGMISIVVYNMFYALAIWILLRLFPWKIIALALLPTFFMMFGMGSFIFFIQHQFEEVYWGRNETYDFSAAGIDGSSFWDLSRLGHWFTGNIGYHHVHHLNIGIPNYNLKAAHLALYPHIKDRLAVLSFWKSLTLFSYKLYDEEAGRLVKL